MTSVSVGELLKDWRSRRRVSQLDLAYRADVSPKHLSFVETGRSRPSPELLMSLAVHLDVPLRDRNTLLLAAGHAPRYQETAVDHPDLAQIMRSVHRFIDAHLPYPAIVLDATGNLLLANAAAALFIGLLPDHLRTPPINMFRASLHPDGLARSTVNLDAWTHHLLDNLDRLAITSPPGIDALRAEIHSYPNVIEHRARRHPTERTVDPLVPYELDIDGHRLSLFTTLMAFGTPRDITLADMTIELFFPNDTATAEYFHRATQPPNSE